MSIFNLKESKAYSDALQTAREEQYLAMVALNESHLDAEYRSHTDSDDMKRTDLFDADASRTYAGSESDYDEFENFREDFETEAAGTLLLVAALTLSGVLGALLIGSAIFWKTHDAVHSLKNLKIFKKN